MAVILLAASLLFLGKIDKAAGNEKRAHDFFRKVLDVAPNNHEAKREVRLYQMRQEKAKEGGGFFGRLFKK